MKHRIIILALGILFLAACAPPAQPAVDLAAVRAAIDANNAKFMEAFNKGDAAGVAALYTEDAIVLPAGGPASQGRQKIQEDVARDIQAASLGGLSLKTSEVEASGDLVVETGTFSVSAGGQEDNGKYLVVWKKQADGSWKIHRDIWNSSQPPPAPAGSEGGEDKPAQ